MKIAPLAMAISLGYQAQAIKLKTYAGYDPSFDYSQFDGGEYSSKAGIPAAAKFIALSRAPKTFDDGTCEIYVGFQAPDGGGAKMPDIQGFAISAQPGGFDLEPPTVVDSKSDTFIWRWAGVNEDPSDSKYGTAFGVWQDFPVGPLKGDQQYTIHISSMNANGAGNLGKVTGNGDPTLGAMEVKCPPGPPGIPQNVQVINPTLYTLDVSWEASLTTGGDTATISAYHVHFEDEADPFASVPAEPFLTTKDGLTPATTYKFKVCADNSYYTRCSDFASGTTLVEAPGAPKNLNATGVSPHDIDTTWEAPDFDGGAAIEGYYLYHSVDETFDESTQQLFSNDTFQNLWEGYDKNTYHCYWVSAFNVAGEGPRTGPICDWTFKTIPSPPIQLAAEAITFNSFDITYGEPVDFGGVEVLIKYDWFIQTENVAPGADATPITVPFPELRASATGLQRATDYYVWGRATNEVGDSLWADLNDDTTDDNDRGECTSGANCGSKITTAPTEPSAPENLGAAAQSPHDILTNWDVPADDGGRPITHYTLYHAVDETFDELSGVQVSADLLDNLFEGYGKNTFHCYWVSATNEVGESAITGPACDTTFKTVPSPPIHLAASAITSTSFDLSYDHSLDFGGLDELIKYDLFIQEQNVEPAADAVPITVAYPGLFAAVDGLRRATDYYVWARATNEVGDSLWADLNDDTADDNDRRECETGLNCGSKITTAATEPTAPENLAAAAQSPHDIFTNWDVPADDGGRPITHYTLYHAVDETFDELSGVQVSADLLDNLFEGYGKNTFHCYWVSATNEVGESARTGPACDTTFKTVPSPPIDLVASGITATSFDLDYQHSLDFGGLDELIKYDLFIQTANVEPTADDVPITVAYPGLHAVANGLTRATDYWVWARATNEVGDSLWADLNDDTADDNDRGECTTGVNCGSKITTQKTVPSAPQNLNGEALSPNSNGNDWTAPVDDGGAPILYYNLYTSQDEVMPAEETLSVDTLDYIWNGLPKYSYWCYWVTAVNEVGESLAAGPVCLNTQSTVPSHAFWQDVYPISETETEVYWNEPADNGGKPILGYKLYLEDGCQVGVPTGEPVQSVDGSTFSAIFTVEKNHDYTVFVIPYNEDGNAEFEISGKPFNTHAQIPSADSPFSITAGQNSATLHFDLPSSDGNAPLTHFNIYNDFGELIGEPDTSVREWPVSGLKSGGHYCFDIAVSNKEGESEYSEFLCVDV